MNAFCTLNNAYRLQGSLKKVPVLRILIRILKNRVVTDPDPGPKDWVADPDS
jgi:hypothetical protein